MAKQSKTAIDAPGGRRTFMVRASHCRIVGLDVHIPGHHLNDGRATLPLDPVTTQDIAERGQDLPCAVTKDDEDPYLLVVAGRQRVKHIRLINKQNGTEAPPEYTAQEADEFGERLVEVFAVRRGCTPQDIEDMSHAENAHRIDTSPIIMAQNAAAYLKRYGGDDQDEAVFARCASIFKLEPRRLKQLLDGYENASPELLKRAKRGEMGVQSFLALSSMSHSEQVKAIEDCGDAGQKVSTSKARAAARVSRGKSVAPTKREQRKKLSAWDSEDVQIQPVDPVAMMKWMLGEGDEPDWQFKKRK